MSSVPVAGIAPVLDPAWAVRLFEDVGLEFRRLRPDLGLPGSPERCVARFAAEDAAGALWVVECLSGEQAPRRERVARVQQALVAAALAGVPAWRVAVAGGHAVAGPGGAWQVAPFVPGDPLPRPGYVEHAARGTALADFLGRMRRACAPALALAAPAADLPQYAANLIDVACRNRPGMSPVLAEVRHALEPLFASWSDLPRTLVHGDYHPLNVIWAGCGVGAVIDWEFTGAGPELYDAANMLGCVGSEDPYALGRGLCAAFVGELREQRVLRPGNGHVLFPLTLALRLAWLAEWLRRDDTGMLEMEMAYMPLLLRSREALERVWGLD